MAEARAIPYLGDHIVQRFHASYIIEANSGCWLWNRRLRWAGYGEFGIADTRWLAHRISFTIARGSIPEGMVLDHKCRVRSCVNPDHLRVVTNRTNTLENSKSTSALNAQKTHCKRGHPFTPENIYWCGPKRNRRQCLACRPILKRIELDKRKIRAALAKAGGQS